MKKFVYSFEEGNRTLIDLLGSKGSGLAEMKRMGIPVPDGFTITTESCRIYNKTGIFPMGMERQVMDQLKNLEKKTRKIFGDAKNPQLVSVRSGAKFSMPGMMDTILNLGFNDNIVPGLIRMTGNKKFVFDSYRRFIQMFSTVVLKLSHDKFEHILEKYREHEGVKTDSDLKAETLEKIVQEFKVVAEEQSLHFPEDPYTQLIMAIKSVFDSWQNPRAFEYRKQNDIPHDLGTSATIQMMVFGNYGNDSGTGVIFSRNPSSGANELYGEFLMHAQGEDIVAGLRTPHPIQELQKKDPKNYRRISDIARRLERHFMEMQDIEFTIEKKKLYILQTRSGKRSPHAAVRIAVDFVKNKIITRQDALLRIKPQQLDQLLHRRIDHKAQYNILAHGIGASPGVAIGEVVFDVAKAVSETEKGKRVILVRQETSPDDYRGMIAARGVLTSRGGATSHAAIVTRSEGKPCVVGCGDIQIDTIHHCFRSGETVVPEGDVITIDGTNGAVIIGEVPTLEAELTPEIKTLLRWADEIRKLGIRANADSAEAAALAKRWGAEGIGLCRTERMFNEPDRLPIVQKMILADSYEERMKFIQRLLPMQKKDFKEIFRVMEGLPVTIRLLDPPLHEFLPRIEDLILEIDELERFEEGLINIEVPPPVLKELTKNPDSITGKFFSEVYHLKNRRFKELEEKKHLLEKVRKLMEINPMLGHRGVRLGLTYPEIYDMQSRAIFQAYAELMKEGTETKLEIMVPQVCTLEELKFVHNRMIQIKKEVEIKNRVDFEFQFGAMIEVVRACMRAGKLAEIAEFFSFGTNDLTQATFSFSREDAEAKFLPLYNERKILQNDPFQVLDRKGVGRLMMITVEWGKKTRKNIKIGICGEHGGDPSSIEFCNEIRLDYVSCSPYRIPIARLAAAQAVIKAGMEKQKQE